MSLQLKMDILALQNLTKRTIQNLQWDEHPPNKEKLEARGNFFHLENRQQLVKEKTC